MITESKLKHNLQIAIKLINGSVIATIGFNQERLPVLSVTDKRYEKRLRDILAEIEKKPELPIQIEPDEGKSAKGKIMISDRVHYYSPGEEGYECALADELVHYRLADGSQIRGIVKP